MGAPIGNKYAVGNNGGRPAHFSTPEDLILKIDEYFNELDENEPVTVTGLCLHLGFSSRSSMVDYEKRGDEFSHAIKRARLRVEHEYEKGLHGERPTGAIFGLKNMGWADRSEVDHTSKGQKIGEPDLTKYTDDELRLIADLQRKGGTSEA